MHKVSLIHEEGFIRGGGGGERSSPLNTIDFSKFAAYSDRHNGISRPQYVEMRNRLIREHIKPPSIDPEVRVSSLHFRERPYRSRLILPVENHHNVTTIVSDALALDLDSVPSPLKKGFVETVKINPLQTPALLHLKTDNGNTPVDPDVHKKSDTVFSAIELITFPAIQEAYTSVSSFDTESVEFNREKPVSRLAALQDFAKMEGEQPSLMDVPVLDFIYPNYNGTLSLVGVDEDTIPNNEQPIQLPPTNLAIDPLINGNDLFNLKAEKYLLTNRLDVKQPRSDNDMQLQNDIYHVDLIEGNNPLTGIPLAAVNEVGQHGEFNAQELQELPIYSMTTENNEDVSHISDLSPSSASPYQRVLDRNSSQVRAMVPMEPSIVQFSMRDTSLIPNKKLETSEQLSSLRDSSFKTRSEHQIPVSPSGAKGDADKVKITRVEVVEATFPEEVPIDETELGAYHDNKLKKQDFYEPKIEVIVNAYSEEKYGDKKIPIPEMTTQLIDMKERLSIDFSQTHPKVVDIIFILDTSVSMKHHLITFRERFSSFLSGLQGLDWKIGFTNADCGGSILESLSLKGEFMNLEHDGTILEYRELTPYIPHFNEIFLDTISRHRQGTYQKINQKGRTVFVHGCELPPFCMGYNEQPLYALMLALEKNVDFFRKDSQIVAVVLTNSQEGNGELTATQPEDVVFQFETLFGIDRMFRVFGVHILPGDTECIETNDDGQFLIKESEFSEKLFNLTHMTGGQSFSICSGSFGRMSDSIYHVIKEDGFPQIASQ